MHLLNPTLSPKVWLLSPVRPCPPSGHCFVGSLLLPCVPCCTPNPAAGLSPSRPSLVPASEISPWCLVQGPCLVPLSVSPLCSAWPGPPSVTVSHTGLSSCCLPYPSQGRLPGPCCDFAEGKARCLLAGRPSSQARVLRAALPSPASWWLCHHEGAALPWASCPHTLLAAASQAGFVTGGWGCAGRW